MGNLWGQNLKVMTFGESHGPALGCVLDGIPAGVTICIEDIAAFLKRRRPGQGPLTSARQEDDVPRILSGLDPIHNVTLGSPLTIVVENRDARPHDYNPTQALLRPSHADYTYLKKYGLPQQSGSGRASARETVGRVAAAAVAKQIIKHRFPSLDVLAWTQAIGPHEMNDEKNFGFADIEQSSLRCPNREVAAKMEQAILEAKQTGDTLGGVIAAKVTGVPAGWGEPVFNKCEALLAHAMLSLPATKGFEVGSGFAASRMTGSQHNDVFENLAEKAQSSLNVQNNIHVQTKTNRSGGIQGGITNGMPIEFRVAFKPPSTVFREQQTVTVNGQPTQFTPTGRHDPCVVPRAVPIVEAMTWLVLCDLMLTQTIQESFYATR